MQAFVENDDFFAAWDLHRESLRRLLISLTRDLDLSDDLLQDTYLHACAGYSGYRGGDVRAWFTTIAKNLFYSHVRRLSTSHELLIPPEAIVENDSVVNADVMALKRAIADLSPALCTPLIMKYYGELSYREIAERQDCPIGTAKWRVSEAIRRLKIALADNGEADAVQCGDRNIVRIFDYLSGVLPPGRKQALVKHVTDCESCRTEFDKLARLVKGLDALESDHKMMHIIELRHDDLPVVYVIWSGSIASEPSPDTISFCSDKTNIHEYFSENGIELPLERSQAKHSENSYMYTARRPRPLKPSERWNRLGVIRPTNRCHMPKREDNGTYTIRFSEGPGANTTAFAQVIKLPQGARLISSNPEPMEVRGRERNTLVWRCILQPFEEFECAVRYLME
jgi:RNA polymerase sigma-70 factor (ECF subfamily)